MDPPNPRLAATTVLALLTFMALTGIEASELAPQTAPTDLAVQSATASDALAGKHEDKQSLRWGGDGGGGWGGDGGWGGSGHSSGNDCLKCHDGGGRAPYPSTEVVVQSQVSWQRDNDASFAEWVEGRGNHVEGLQCSECHQPGNAAATFPPSGCDSTCHQWLQPTIQQDGFTTLQGTPAYEGTSDPATLLGVVKDVDSDGRNHKAIYEQFGCTGFCHNDAVTVEKAEAWGGTPSGSQPGGVDPGLTPSDQHGLIVRCTDCHRYDSPLGGPDDLHTTHVPLVQAEQAINNVDAPLTQTACEYCHGSGPYPDAPAGGCYNCHLSGHLPETYYWGYPPEDPPGA